MKTVGISQATVHDDAFYVNWHLLDGCNHDCEYNHEPASAINERFSRDTLLTTAYRLLCLNRPEYVFHLYGGEPTIHPHFPELLKYLTTSGRNVRILLDTNGLRSLDYYKQLLKGIPRGRLCVHIDVHCKYMELEPLLFLVAHVIEAGQHCRVTINHVPEYAEKAQIFAERLLAFRHTLPFELHIAFPMGGDADWQASLQQEFAGICEPSLEIPGWMFQTPEESSQASEEFSSIVMFDEDFSCVGTNAVQVASDGAFTLGLRENDQPFAPQIMEAVSLRDVFPPAPSFSTIGEAKAWLADFRVRALRYELDGGPVRHPLRAELDEEQQLRVRLKRLKADSPYRRKRTPQPELWQERQHDVLRALSCLKDEDSRTVFLRSLKAQLVGDSAYLVRSAYAQFEHPGLNADLSTEDPACRLLRLNEVSQENVSALLPRIQWYQPALELVLPQTAQWIDILIELHDALPEYQLFLGQHGMQTVLYGVPSVPRKRYLPVPPRTIDGQPLVSVILVASDEEGVSQSIESVFAQNLPRYEIIVVQDADAASMGNLLDGFVRRAPWQVRPFRLEGTHAFCTACDAGLDMAQGEYVCFLHAGDTLAPGVLHAAVQALESEQADIAVTSPSAVRTSSFEGPAVLTRFLIGQLGQSGTRDKVYRSSLIHDRAITFTDLPGQMEDDLFNLPVFHFASKAVLCAGELAVPAEGVDALPQDIFKVFLVGLDTLARFCAAHELGMEKPEVRAYVLRHFREVKPALARSIRDAENNDTLDDVLDAAALRSLTRPPALVQAVCEELAPANCRTNNLSAVFSPAFPSVVLRPYEGASDVFEVEYPLSLVVTVEEGASLACLERLVQENCGLVECIIIDNVTSEETSLALEAYADMYPNFRLFRMKEKCLPAQCRNAGLEQARGEAVTFMESGDELMPDFAEAAVEAMSDKTVDVSVFGVQRVNADGVTDFPFMNADAQSGTDIAVFFLEKGMKLDTAGMVFRRDRLIQNDIAYNVLSPEWQAEFTLRALQNATARMRSECVYLHSEKAMSSPVAAYPQSLEALCAFYTLLQMLTESCTDAAVTGLHTAFSQSLTHAWLPCCTAFVSETGSVPLTDVTMDALQQAPFFLRRLFSEYAQNADAE